MSTERTQELMDLWIEVWKRHVHTDGQPLDKLPEEVAEFLEDQDPDDRLAEAADVIIVVLTQMQWEGYRTAEVMDEVNRKLLVNIFRRWARNPDGTISHVKDSA